MTRKRIKHEKIPNESKRNATFGKRSEGLLKKANELSVLCGVDLAVIVHKRGESNTILWPSSAVVRERLQKFLDFSNLERERRMVTHEKYMEQAIKAEADDVLKFKKAMELKESHQLMNEFMQRKSFDRYNLNQMNGLNSLANDMLKQLGKRDNELNDVQHQV